MLLLQPRLISPDERTSPTRSTSQSRCGSTELVRVIRSPGLTRGSTQHVSTGGPPDQCPVRGMTSDDPVPAREPATDEDSARAQRAASATSHTTNRYATSSAQAIQCIQPTEPHRSFVASDLIDRAYIQLGDTPLLGVGLGCCTRSLRSCLCNASCSAKC